MAPSTPQSNQTPTSSGSEPGDGLAHDEVEALARAQRAQLHAELAAPDPARCEAIRQALAQVGVRLAPDLPLKQTPADLLAAQVEHDVARRKGQGTERGT